MLRVTQPVLYDYRSTEEFLLHSQKYLLFLSLQQVNILAFRGMKTVFTSWFSQEISCTRVRRIQHGIGHDYWWEQSISKCTWECPWYFDEKCNKNLFVSSLEKRRISIYNHIWVPKRHRYCHHFKRWLLTQKAIYLILSSYSQCISS